MTRKGFHILLALILVVCVLCPYVEVALDWNQTIFNTGYDGETVVAVIALLLILAFALARLLVSVLGDSKGGEPLGESPRPLRSLLNFVFSLPDVSPPPLPLRI